MAKMTNGELGALLGISDSYASLLRRNIRVPHTDRFIAIVATLDLDPREALAAVSSGTFGDLMEEAIARRSAPADLPEETPAN